MSQRIVLVHGWGGNPSSGWFSWLSNELEGAGFTVVAPQLPDTDNPEPNAWVEALGRVVGESTEDTYFIGHSLGCQTIMRHLAHNKVGTVAGGAIFVAGFFDQLTGLEINEKLIWDKWRMAKFDVEKTRASLKRSVAIFSDDDTYVPLTEQKNFEDRIGSETIVLHKMGHFTWSTGCVELPLVLKKLREMTENERGD
jgi:uncharacterized protein